MKMQNMYNLNKAPTNSCIFWTIVERAGVEVTVLFHSGEYIYITEPGTPNQCLMLKGITIEILLNNKQNGKY